MTSATKEIFENHEIRKSKAQRQRFREYIISYARSLGYTAKEEKASKSAYNVIVGNPETASVVYTAHYDTCAVMPMPNFITPKCVPLYLIYQLFLTLIIYIIPISVMIGARHVLDATSSDALFSLTLLGGYAILILFSFLMIAGPANKHTANDNTSGVTLITEIMTDLPEEQRDKVAFIFFDLEELGMIGSKGYVARHKALAGKMLIINFDCVSDGKTMLFVVKKKAADIVEKLEVAFKPSDTYSVDIVTRGAFYPSDQINFRHGIGVAAMNKTKRGLLYMNRIHTPRDTVYDEENIKFLKSGAIEFAKLLVERG